MKHFKKLSVLFSVFCLILALCLPTFAAEYATDEIDESIPWEYDYTTNRLTHGDTVYEEYYLAPGFVVISPFRYTYAANIAIDPYDYGPRSYVRQIMPADGVPEVLHDIALVYPYYDAILARVYVTPEGRQLLDDFVNGNFASYEFGMGISQRVETDGQYWQTLGSTQPDLMLDVQMLRSAQEFFIYGIDESGNFARPIGNVYRSVDGHGWVYVDYRYLEPSQFNANGSISFHQGQIPAFSMDQSVAEEHYERYDASDYRSFKTYSQATLENGEPEMDQTPALIIFALMMSPFLFIAPILLLTLGIVLRSVKKIPSRKRWNALIVLPSLWLLCSIAITVLCIVAIVI